MPAQPTLILQLLHQRAGMAFAAIEQRRQLADGNRHRRAAELLVQTLILAEAVGQAHDRNPEQFCGIVHYYFRKYHPILQ
ncbi:hypothetical protein D3C79_558850 [compost metagenome]